MLAGRHRDWLVLCLGAGLACVPALAQDVPWQEVTPAASSEPLLNPGMGIYLQYPPMDSTADEWFVRIAGTAYYRMDWSDLEPAEGDYRFDEVLGPIFDHWVGQLGRRVAFRVMCENMHSAHEYVTPQWAFDSGVPGVEHVGLYVPRQVDPVFWDERYLAVQCRFVAALGAWLDGRAGLEFVDVGSIGEWGEMHLGLHAPGRWTPEQLDQTGFTEERYIAAYRRVLDAHHRAFPTTRVFLNVGGADHLTINDYAARLGMHFRQDGLQAEGASYHVESDLFLRYAPMGVLGNLEFFADWNGMIESGWPPEQAVETALASPISYLNTNLFGGGGYRSAPPEAVELLTRAASRIGYRLRPAWVSWPVEVGVAPDRPGRLPVRARWVNDGTAAPDRSFALEWTLVGADGRAIAQARSFPSTPTNLWTPGAEIETAAVLRIPAGTPSGEARVLVRVSDPERGAPIALALAGAAGGPYELGTTRVVERALADWVVLREDFEAGTGDWGAAEGIALSADGGGAHSGSRSLLVAGRTERTWNYANRPVPGVAHGGARYRLTAWVLVESLGEGSPAPYLKLASSTAGGAWLTNANTAAYDVRRAGEWQRLSIETDIPAEAGSLSVAIEKGSYEGAAEVRMRVDDLAVELTEGP